MHLNKKPTLHRNHRRSITESRFPSVPISEMFFLFLFSSLLCYLSLCALAPNCIFAKKAPPSHSLPLQQMKCKPGTPPCFFRDLFCNFLISYCSFLFGASSFRPFQGVFIILQYKVSCNHIFPVQTTFNPILWRKNSLLAQYRADLSVFIHFQDYIYCSRSHIYRTYRNHSFQIHSPRSLIHSQVPGYRYPREARFLR